MYIYIYVIYISKYTFLLNIMSLTVREIVVIKKIYFGNSILKYNFNTERRYKRLTYKHIILKVFILWCHVNGSNVKCKTNFKTF